MLVCWHLVTGRSLTFLKVFRFIFSIFLNHQLKLRTVRTSFHQRGFMWTILKHAWTCVRWFWLGFLTFLRTMTSSQALNPLGQCEWLLFHYSPAKEEKSFIPPYLNCEVGKISKYVYSDVQTISTMFYKLCIISEFIQITQPHLTEMISNWKSTYHFPAVCSRRCQLGPVREHLW